MTRGPLDHGQKDDTDSRLSRSKIEGGLELVLEDKLLHINEATCAGMPAPD
jgi:hypothetical protein